MVVLLTAQNIEITKFVCYKNCFILKIIITIFTARSVCIARTMPWQDVRLSARPSVRHTPVLCLNGYTYPQSVFTVG